MKLFRGKKVKYRTLVIFWIMAVLVYLGYYVLTDETLLEFVVDYLCLRLRRSVNGHILLETVLMTFIFGLIGMIWGTWK